MDIHRWLDETVQPNLTPSLPEHSGVGHSVCPGKPVPRGRHRRKRSKSDSSLLEPLDRREKTPTEKQNPPTEGSTDDSADSETTHATHSERTESSISSLPYARKPRRKTRPDRYEPSSKAVKERGKHAHRSRKSESKQARRKSKRKKCEKVRSGIVQSFHAKNVSGDRLTLKPPGQLGIFNKGKTSMAVKGRGLPDLVFSEMKFLQKHKDQPVPIPQEEVSKKKRKNDHVHTKEGEISAFFTTTVHPVLAEENGNIQVKEGCQTHDTLPKTSRCERERSLVVDTVIPAIPTIELPEEASNLGFGSRGPHHESTSDVSWSESMRTPSTIPAHPRTKPVVYSNHRDSVFRGGEGMTSDQKDASFKRPVVPSFSRQGTTDTVERFGVSSVAPSLHRMSRAQSYPQHTSSPRRVNLIDRAAKFQGTDTVGSPSSMPPVVPVRASVDVQQVRTTDSSKAPRSRATSLSGTNIPSTQRQPTLHGGGIHGDTDPQTSSDLGRVLQRCDSTFSQRPLAAVPHRRNTGRETPVQFAYGAGQQFPTRSYPTTDRGPTVRFADVDSRAPPLSNFAGPSIYEQQAQRQQLPLQPTFEETFLNDINLTEEDFLDEDDCMSYVDQSCEELPEEPVFHKSKGESGTYRFEEVFVMEDTVQHSGLEGNAIAPGFWRPNRLY